MFNFIRNLLGFKSNLSALSAEEMQILAAPRSSKWKKTRIQHLVNNPCCAVCGSSKNVVPHHIIPVHLDKSKELDPNNLISLCENDNFNCHFFFGHFKNWTKHNSNIVEDARIWFEKTRQL